jgi:hypothetical protein
MRRFLSVLAIAALTVSLYASSAPGARQARAGAQTSTEVVALQKQVRVLQKQVRELQGRTTLLRSQMVWTLEMIETARRLGETCLAALTADEFQNTWSQVDRLAVGLGAQPVFGTQMALDDRKSCQGLGVARPPLDPAVPPTVGPFDGFMLWLNGR